jgi:phytoene dehydrogenase-like protein
MLKRAANVVKSAMIVGAGVGGLCTAALLARSGVDVTVLEKRGRVGGRTASETHRNHTLDNGFHIMPFYKKSALYVVLRSLGIAEHANLTPVTDIAFHSGGLFHRYPAGITGILGLTLMPFWNRLKLLRLLLPMAFASMGGAERLDDRPLEDVTGRLDSRTRAFFDAVCMLAFADVPGRVSLGEFVRTIIRANPFRGGTSRFAYPAGGGYDSICHVLVEYVRSLGGEVRLSAPVRSVEVRGGRARGAVDGQGNFTEADCVIVSAPAHQAANLVGREELGDQTISDMNRLNQATSVVEVHFALDRRLDRRHIVFPVGDGAAKGVFLTSNICPALCPPGEHQMIAGAPVDAETAGSGRAVREMADRMRQDIEAIYPGFLDHIIWERPRAWKFVEATAKRPGLVWRSKMPHTLPHIGGLFFVGDSTISYGIGTDSAAHSALLCHPRILEWLTS